MTEKPGIRTPWADRPFRTAPEAPRWIALSNVRDACQRHSHLPDDIEDIILAEAWLHYGNGHLNEVIRQQRQPTLTLAKGENGTSAEWLVSQDFLFELVTQGKLEPHMLPPVGLTHEATSWRERNNNAAGLSCVRQR